MKIVVFGASGWVGRAVLDNLAGRHEIRAVDRGPEAWAEWEDIDGAWDGGEVIHGDIADYAAVDRAIAGMDAVIHLAVYFPTKVEEEVVADEKPFLVNLKGLWNVLHSTTKRSIRRVVHLGSCPTIHPRGEFFTSEVRRPDCNLYTVGKRLQEELCRQFHEGAGQSIIVLRPDYVVDSRIGVGRYREKLGEAGTRTQMGWVCRHDLAEACRLAAESDTPEFDVLHVVGTPGAEKHCNVARTREILGLEFKGDLEKYR